MFSLKLSILCYIFSIDSYVLPIIVDQESGSITAVLRSYADALSTVQPSEQTKNYPSLDSTTTYPQVHTSERSFYTLSSVSPPSTRSASLTSAKSETEPTWADTRTVSSKKSKELVEGSTEDSDDQSWDPDGPPDHIIPFSEHENPQEPSTRPNYTAPGVWARPPPEKNISLDFVPTKLYAQVRGTHTVSHVPKEEAVKSAETDEEKANAARLREVVKVSKANTVYTEEGYEDAAYDHAGHVRDADFHEGFARKLNEEAQRGLVAAHTKKKPKRNRNQRPRKNKSRSFGDLNDDYSDHLEVTGNPHTFQEKLEPQYVEKLKKSIEKPNIDPKRTTLDGILQLERDLMKESDEATNVPMLQSSHSMINETLVAKPKHGTEEISEATTVRYNVFTVRPKKPEASTQTNHNILKFRRPAEYRPNPESNVISNSQSGLQFHRNLNFVNSAVVTTNLPQSSTLNNFENLSTMPITTYHPLLPESQSENTVIANPLAVATLNGHGPYLVVVTSPSSVLPPKFFWSQETDSAVPYIAPTYESTTRESKQASNQLDNPLDISSNQRLYSEDRGRPHLINSDTKQIFLSDSVNERRDVYSNKMPDNIRVRDGTSTPKNQNRNSPAFRRRNKFDSFLRRKPQLIQNSISKRISVYPDNIKKSSGKGKEMTDIQYFQSNQEAQMTGTPATKLLPPAPLSTSEYASFLRGMNNEPIPPLLMSLVPVIEDIHRKEFENLPFLFRRKRSTMDHNRGLQREQSDRNSRGFISSRAREDKSNTKHQPAGDNYPKTFARLLNESPKVATQFVDSEIQNRFGNESRGDSHSKGANDITPDNNTSSESIEELAEEFSIDADLPASDHDDDSDLENESLPNELDIDTKKYPFYSGSSNTALKYMVNPLEVPRKTLGGMEFYNSRHRECEDIEPNLEKIVPTDDELDGKLGPRDNQRRLNGLGGKLDCYKAKYFDENPLDNPLFSEKSIAVPPAPPELNPFKFASRILELPPNKDEYVIPRGPKSPENVRKRKLSSTGMAIHRKNPNGRHVHFPRVRGDSIQSMSTRNGSHQSKIGPGDISKNANKIRNKSVPKKRRLKVTPEYQRQVYEDVMGTIMNQGKAGTGRFRHAGISKPRLRYVFYGKDRMRDGHAFEQRELSNMYRRPTQSLQLSEGQSSDRYNRLILLNPRGNISGRKHLSHRIFKRSAETKVPNEFVKVQEATQSTNHTNENTDEPTIVSETSKVSRRKKKRKPVVLVKDGNGEQHDKNGAPDPTGIDFRKYGRFQEGNLTSSDQTRRNEPRYYVPRRNISLPVSSTLPSPPITNISSLSDSHISEPVSSSSTLIPVIMKFEPDSTNKELRSSASRAVRNGSNQSPKADDSIKSKNEGKTTNKNQSKDENVTGSIYGRLEEHPTLRAFLEGDPPGYAEAFNDEKSSRSIDEQVRSDNHNVRDEGRSVESSDSSGEGDDSSEKYVGEGTSENAKEQSTEDVESRRLHHSSEKDDKSSERYSDRPYSPPENYEDEKYSDLGPRINKPYFYHPPFEVPDYEKFKSEVPVADDLENLSGSEESKTHEQYAETSRETGDENDSDEEEASESRKYHLNRYEYPWERRNRRNKGRRERQESSGPYSSATSQEDEDEEATLTRPIYVPLKNEDHMIPGGINRTDALGESSQSRFHNKLQSGFSTIPLGDQKLLVTVANNENIPTSTVEYLPNDSNVLPRTSSRTSRKSIRGNTYTISSDDRASRDQDKRVDPTIKTRNVLRDHENSNSMRSTGDRPSTMATMKETASRTRLKENRTKSKAESLIKNSATQSPRRRNLRGQNFSSLGKVTRGGNITHPSTDNIPSNSTPLDRRRRTRLAVSGTKSDVSKPPNLQRNDSTPRFGIRGRMKYHSPTSAPNLLKSRTFFPNTTGRTVEHHSRVSKHEIITKTIYPDDEDDQEGIRESGDSSIDGDVAATSVGFPTLIPSKRRPQPKSDSHKREKIEKVTITMEETPDRMYKTEEIDRDGVKGKFFTIIPYNYNESSTQQIDSDDILHTKPSIRSTNKTFDIPEVRGEHRDDDKAYKIESTAMQGVTGSNSSESRSLPDPETDSVLSNRTVSADENVMTSRKGNEDENQNKDEDEDENEDSDEDEDEDDVENEDDEIDSGESEESVTNVVKSPNVANEDNGNKRESIAVPQNDTQIEGIQISQNTTTPVVNIVKDPNSRQYFYVE